MPESESVETTDTDQDAVDESITSDTSGEEEGAETEDPTAGLKKALAAERKAHREAARKLSALEAARADADKEPAEQALEQARREAREEAQTAFNQRLVQAELRAALAGKVNNPALALKVIDASEIDVDANGEVDAQSVTDAIESALSQYPELKPADSKKFGGTADQGSKGRGVRPHQLSREELAALTPEGRVEAHANGQLDDLLGGKG
jgi:multidrug efflux pump subunit AcrA (membrane-fusion protein)